MRDKLTQSSLYTTFLQSFYSLFAVYTQPICSLYTILLQLVQSLFETFLQPISFSVTIKGKIKRIGAK
jgi:hypothetical protein